MQDKKAISTVFATMLLIVLVLVAIVIIWALVGPALRRAGEEQKAKEIALLTNVEIARAWIENGALHVKVKRGADSSDISDIQIVYNEGSTFVKKDLGKNVPSPNGEIEYAVTNLKNLPSKVEIAIQIGVEGKKYLSDTKDTKNIENFNDALTQGLVAHWKFDEQTGTTASDSSGNGNNGVLLGSPSWVVGKANYALQFDGIDDRVSAGNNASINLGANYQPFTYAAWINPINAPRNVFIINKGDSITGYMQIRMQTLSTGVLYCGWRNNSWELLSSNISIQSNNWSHVAFVYNGANQFIYINGVQRGTRVASLPPPSRSTYLPSLLIGGYVYNSINSSLNGTLDEVRIYNRSLSQAEINTLYSQGL